ncbi:MAG: hypothetical protein A2Y53_07165 [Chloroflexi bacterium RBG_16_47_49]|nr:MAG: hypothetical protein A2Y53_07165 [Chloroflexi bacterium RBG_16_47_49]
MSNVQRWYIYIVCAISLQGVTWAVIELLRNLIVFGGNQAAVAFQIAVIIIGLPVFLVHWLRGRWFVAKSLEEQGTTLRRFYLYATLAAFLEPFIANAFDLIRRLLGGVFKYQSQRYNDLPFGDAVPFHLIALIVLAILWYYHQRIIADDSRIVPDTGSSATVRRLYVLGFSAAGLSMIVTAIIHLIRWIMLELGSREAIGYEMEVVLIDEIAWLVVGVPLWLIFWSWAQRLFYGPKEEEHNSALRKLYLYGAVLLGALDVVGNTTGILASLIRRLLVETGEPGGDIRQPLPIIIGMGMLWIYHALVLRKDTKQAGEAPRQAGVRRIYLYLIAGVGFAALLVGLCGEISVILRALDKSFGVSLRGEFGWFTAAIIAGLPVWIIPWRQAQAVVTAEDTIGADARRSVVRRIYLYFFLFIATMTVLASAVYIVYRILSMVLGEEPPTLTELGHAISFSIIAIAVGLYHLRILRTDGSFSKREKAGLLEALHIVVLDVGEGHFGRQLVEQLKREIPDVSLDPVILASKTAETEDSGIDQDAITNQLASAGLIIGPWAIAIPGGNGAVSPQIAQAVLSSPARKLLVPFYSEGWDWVGVDRWDTEAFLRKTVHAVKQVLAGEEVKAHHPMGAGAIIGIIIAVLIVLGVLISAVSRFFAY